MTQKRTENGPKSRYFMLKSWKSEPQRAQVCIENRFRELPSWRVSPKVPFWTLRASFWTLGAAFWSFGGSFRIVLEPRGSILELRGVILELPMVMLEPWGNIFAYISIFVDISCACAASSGISLASHSLPRVSVLKSKHVCLGASCQMKTKKLSWTH